VAKAQDGMRRWTVGIVGGGPGGLFTAYLLEQLASPPPSITIFEASERLGGKVITERFSAGGPRYEAGAAELYDYSAIDHDPLKELIEELRLPILPMGGTAISWRQQLLSTLDDIRDYLGPMAADSLVAFDRRAKSEVSPREFYEAIHASPRRQATAGPANLRFSNTLSRMAAPARQLVEQFIHSDLATEPAATSHHYGLDNYVMNDPAYMELYCIAGGNEQLIDRLAARLTAQIYRRHQITAVSSSMDGRLRLDWRTQSATGHDEFDAVVLALPVAPLASLTFSDLTLASAMQRHLDHYDHPGHYLRISVLFEEPFWRKWLKDSYCMLDAFGGCCLYDESTREPSEDRGVLGWLLGGDAAEQWAEASDEELVAAALHSLPFDRDRAAALQQEARVHRWIGAVSGQPGGFTPQSLDARHCPAPLSHPQLLVVGDYLFDSTLNGVLDSAEHAAGWLATMIASGEPPTASSFRLRPATETIPAIPRPLTRKAQHA